MLKADFHVHTGEDPKDRWIRYSAKQAIDKAAEKGLEVISITNHQDVNFSRDLKEYAEKKGILLIPGVEARVEGKDVVIINSPSNAAKIKTFDELRRFKKQHKESFIFAPHPFYLTPICLGSRFFEHKDIFEGIEYCHWYTIFFNLFNKRAVRAARKLKMPMIGTSDAHEIRFIGKTYTLVDSKKNTKSIISALKKGKIKTATRPLSFSEFAYILSRIIKRFFARIITLDFRR